MMTFLFRTTGQITRIAEQGYYPYQQVLPSRILPSVESGVEIGGAVMRGSAEIVNVRVAEAAGVLANNDKLRVNGKWDPVAVHPLQAVGAGHRAVLGPMCSAMPGRNRCPRRRGGVPFLNPLVIRAGGDGTSRRSACPA